MTYQEILQRFGTGNGKKSGKKKYRRLESDIQQSCVEWFRYTFPQYIIAAVPNGGSRNAIEAAGMKREGVLAGFADLIIIADHRVLFVEMKTKKNKQQASQIAFQHRVEVLGHKYVVCHSLDEFIAAVNAWLKGGKAKPSITTIANECCWGTSVSLSVGGRSLLRMVFKNNDKESCELYDLATHPLYMRRGFATLLMREAESLAVRRGCARLYLFVDKGSWQEQWYRRLGFVEEELWEPPYPNTLWMVKFIKENAYVEKKDPVKE